MTYSPVQTSGLPDPVTDPEFYDNVPLKRALAWVIDAIAIVLLSVVSGFMTLGVAFLFAGLLFLATSFIYRVAFISTKSATLGMLFMGIEFRTFDGRKFDFKDALLHTGVYTITSVTGFLRLVSILTIATTQYGRSIPDFVLGSTAINKPL